MFMFSFGLLRRVVTKPLLVIFFRFKQEGILRLKLVTGFWQKFSYKTEQYLWENIFFDSSTVLINSGPVILNELQRKALYETTSSIMSSQFKLFGHRVPNLEECDFASDWRFKKKWPNQYYKNYKFYEEKSVPYDVKFPWELSRLHYLVPVLAWQWADKTDYVILEKIFTLLNRWREENPLAYSVNWYPMEASMRVITLVMMLDFVRLLKNREVGNCSAIEKLEKQLVIMLAEHGEFVWANREFTDVRGNHFTANLVALLLASVALGTERQVYGRWRLYAMKWLDKEIFLQFCADGVNFEKSCAYHKLVLELFMLAAVVRERMGKPFAASNKLLLANAACYSDAVMRPDGIAANFGDTDDAIALPFTIDNPRSHAPVVELARAFFNKDLGTVPFDEKDKLASLFILGFSRQQQMEPKEREIINFPVGGYIVVRCQAIGFFFMVDVGEVGMSGRGGHGHNDLLSFELCIAGQAIVVDPGCSGYTSDLVKKNLYRSTFSHSTVGLFGEEIARFSGHWGICNDAHPLNIGISEQSEAITIRAGHDGYERFVAGTKVWRSFEVNPEQQEVTIKDKIHIASEEANVCWNFPLGELTPTAIDSNRIILGTNQDVNVTVYAELPVSLVPYCLSHGYGQEIESQKIAAKCRLTKGIHRYLFRFCQNKGQKI